MIDLRSDVKTLPTDEMRKAMAEAEVGDDASGEDPTVNKLQERAAELTGKEAALFVPSGTQGNLVSLMALTQPGQELVTDELAHVLHFETGGCARLAGLMPRTVPNYNGCPDPDDVAAALSSGSATRGATGVVVLENTHNLAGGVAVEPERMQAVAEVAWDHGVKVHVDGARIFNAAVALGRPASDFARWCDTITFCLSKSLGAPAGSLICGSREFIEEARKYRRMLGGAMRQAGILAAAGLVALETRVNRLVGDHRNARYIAETLADLPGVEIDLDRVQTNMVYFKLQRDDLTSEDFIAAMADQGILVAPPMGPVGQFRLVTHHNVSEEDTAKVCTALKAILGS
ncbi:MAG: aminotransferase class I/II-fold pyridoxal phosphate-dependent enzyme [Armatimonadetes bacterium]|nr:aminotransferase class I/II-fold pyridoxal phosphate-dependent enzyme [Armatimonadota bacterium]